MKFERISTHLKVRYFEGADGRVGHPDDIYLVANVISAECLLRTLANNCSMPANVAFGRGAARQLFFAADS
jgi:hypothetical protein